MWVAKGYQFQKQAASVTIYKALSAISERSLTSGQITEEHFHDNDTGNGGQMSAFLSCTDPFHTKHVFAYIHFALLMSSVEAEIP